MKKQNNDPRLTIEPNSYLLSLDELTIDVSAFIYFLSTTHETAELGNDIPSFWMLIPKGLDVRWQEGASSFSLEKELFSRIIYIVHPPVPENEKEKVKSNLLITFSPVIANEQTEQVKKLLKGLRPEAREKLISQYLEYKEQYEKRKL